MEYSMGVKKAKPASHNIILLEFVSQVSLCDMYGYMYIWYNPHSVFYSYDPPTPIQFV